MIWKVVSPCIEESRFLVWSWWGLCKKKRCPFDHLDNKLVVGAVFIDFQKTFDCVSHSILLHKLEHNFGITGNLLAWLRDYLSDREQYTVINGAHSENTKVAHGIPQGSLYSGPYSSPCTQAIYRKQLTLQRRSCTLMILSCTVLVNP